MTTDRAFIEQLADTWGALVALGRELAPEEWDAATECPGWAVRDHFAHVAGTEASLLGRPAPPAAPAAPHVRNPLGEMNEAWVVHWRVRPVGDLLAELESVTAERLAAMRAMSDEELEKPGWSPVGEVAYAAFMSIRVMDCWVHEQDVRQATGRPWRLDSPAAAASLDRLLGSLGYVVGKRVAPPEGTVVAVAAGPRERRLAVRDGRAGPAPADAEPTVGLTMPAETFVRLATGRAARPAVALTVVIDGDPVLGQAVLANLATIP